MRGEGGFEKDTEWSTGLDIFDGKTYSRGYYSMPTQTSLSSGPLYTRAKGESYQKRSIRGSSLENNGFWSQSRRQLRGEKGTGHAGRAANCEDERSKGIYNAWLLSHSEASSPACFLLSYIQGRALFNYSATIPFFSRLLLFMPSAFVLLFLRSILPS